MTLAAPAAGPYAGVARLSVQLTSLERVEDFLQRGGTAHPRSNQWDCIVGLTVAEPLVQSVWCYGAVCGEHVFGTQAAAAAAAAAGTKAS